jgi:hypothetical protein
MKFNSIIYIPDIIRGDKIYPELFFDLIGEPILQGCGISIAHISSRISICDGLSFDVDKFVSYIDNCSVGDLNEWALTYNKISYDAVQYLKSFISNDSLILSFEMPPWLIKFCNNWGFRYIDIRLSPMRFGSDLYVALRTNDYLLYERIYGFNVTDQELKLEAAFLSSGVNMHLRKLISQNRAVDANLDNCIVFVGQMPFDAALLSGSGKFLRCVDFSEEIRDIVKCRKVLYKPHPFSILNSSDEILQLVSIVGQTPERCHLSAYQILSSKYDVQLFGISSGMLQEAKYFNKISYTLFRPFISLGSTLSDIDAFSQVHLQKFISPMFWHQVLCPDCSCPVLNQLPQVQHHYSRHLLDQWWDYDKIFSWERSFSVECFNRSGGNLLRNRIDLIESNA